MARKGVLHEVHTAYSRLPDQPKVNATTAACREGGALTEQTMVGVWLPTSPLTSVSLHLLSSKIEARDLPGVLGAETPCSQCRGTEFDPWSDLYHASCN